MAMEGRGGGPGEGEGGGEMGVKIDVSRET